MCNVCDDAVRLYGARSRLALVARNLQHPPTEEYLRALDRHTAELVDYLNAVDEDRDV